MLLVSFVILHWQMQGLEWGFTPKFSLKSFTTYIYLLNIRLFIMMFGLFYGFSFLFHSSLCPYLCQYHGPHRWLSGKEFTCQCRSHRRCQFNPGVRKIPWKRKRQPLQYSCLENPTDRGAWKVTVHGVTKSQTQESTHSASTTLSSLLKLCSKFWNYEIYPLLFQ